MKDSGKKKASVKGNQNKNKTPMTSREIVLVIAVLVLAIVLFVKSMFFDGYVPQNDQEQALYNQFEVVVEEENDSVLYRTHLLSTHIIAVKEEEGVLKGHYRKYILGIIPMGDTYYSSDEE